MPDEDAGRADIAKTALAGGEAEFDVLVVSAPIKLRQTSDGVKAGAGYKQTEADAGRQVGRPQAIGAEGRFVDRRDLLMRRQWIGRVRPRIAGQLTVVGEGRHRADAFVRPREFRHALDRVRRQNHIGIQEQRVALVTKGEGAVDRARKTQIYVIDEPRDAWPTRGLVEQCADARIGRGVVDDDEMKQRALLSKQRFRDTPAFLRNRRKRA